MRKWLHNKWFGFGCAAVLYILWFVIWTGNPWLLLGVPLIYDFYITRYFYRYVWRHNRALAERNRVYKKVYEWVNAIVFATVVATLVHIYFFQMYVIPSSSMERSLLVGDYLYVSKLTYGPKMPNTPVAFPFVHHTMPFSKSAKSFSECIQWPYHRLRGIRNVRRGDVVVFHFPEGDTVALQNQEASYYSLLRADQQRYGRAAGRQRLYDRYTIVHRPVDKRENYIKRCIALPGDTLAVKDGTIWLNGVEQPERPTLEFTYSVQSSVDLRGAIRNLDIHDWDGAPPYFLMMMTSAQAAELARVHGVSSVDRLMAAADEPDPEVFPASPTQTWNRDNYGPIWVPAAGSTVELTQENLPLYERAITVYEGHRLTVTPEGSILIDEKPATCYTFAMDYYWMMGDNRHNSADSRYWGFVPEDHIVGRAAFTWLSLDPSRSFPANIRWQRMFRGVE